MIPYNNNFDLKQLDPNNAYYVACLGNIHLRETKPFISAVLYPLKETPKSNYLETIKYDGLGAQKAVDIEIDFITLLSAGSLIFKNKIYKPEINESLSITSLGISNEKGYTFEQSKKIRKIKDFGLYYSPGFDVPSLGIPFAKHFDQRCLHIKNEIEKTITVIPCIEIIRFYFCSSSNLSENLFNGGLNNNRLAKLGTTSYSDAKLDGTDYLYLAKYMTDRDAQTVARIFLYKEAYRAADAVYRSFALDSQEKKEKSHYYNGYPDGFFPFNDSSQIKVSMKVAGRITDPNSEFKGYLVNYVMRIHQCDKIFLPEGAKFRRENDSGQNEDSNPENTDSKRSLPPENDSKDDISVNSSNNSERREKQHIFDENRFPNAPNEKVQKLPKLEQKTKGTGRYYQNEPGEGSSVGNEGDSESNKSKTSININPKEPNVTEPKPSNVEYYLFLKALYDSLTEYEDFDLTAKSHFFKYLSKSIISDLIPKNKDKPSYIKNYCKGEKIPNKNKYKSLRELRIYHLMYIETNRHFYLIDVMPRLNSGDKFGNMYLVHLSDYSLMKHEHFDSICMHFANQLKIKFKSNYLRYIYRQPFQHEIQASAEFTAKNIINFIIQKFIIPD